MWTIKINQATPSLNKYSSAMSPYIEAKDKKLWWWLIRAADGFLDIPRATGKRRLTILRHGRAIDPDNLIGGCKKCITDNLVELGVLKGDTKKLIEICSDSIPLQKSEHPWTELILEDIN